VVVARCMTHIGMPKLAGEILAACHAAQLCQERNVKDIKFEGDALQVVNAMTSKEHNWSRYGYLMDDMKTILSSFQYSSSYFGEGGNQTSHGYFLQGRNSCMYM
jgi:hypothetical protein